MKKFSPTYREGGFTILISVLVIGAVALSVGISLMFFGTKALQTTEALQSSSRAWAMAHACVEDALEKTRQTGGQAASWNLTISGNTCTYTITNLGGEARRIEAVSTVETSVRRIEVTVASFSNTFVFSSWEEF